LRSEESRRGKIAFFTIPTKLGGIVKEGYNLYYSIFPSLSKLTIYKSRVMFYYKDVGNSGPDKHKSDNEKGLFSALEHHLDRFGWFGVAPTSAEDKPFLFTGD